MLAVIDHCEHLGLNPSKLTITKLAIIAHQAQHAIRLDSETMLRQLIEAARKNTCKEIEVWLRFEIYKNIEV